ncbi:MAG: hypothetical protein MJZ55_00190 [Paludibacteraceae bacterium]|nr:hypothetical protein [Paludibacteraceae bacterium]
MEQNETTAEKLVRLYPAAEDSTSKAEKILIKECVWNKNSVSDAENCFDKWRTDIANWGRTHATEKLAAEDIINSIYAAIVATAAEDKKLVGISYNGMPDWQAIAPTDARGDIKPLINWPDRLKRWDMEQAEKERREEAQLKKWREGANQYFKDFLNNILKWEYNKLHTVHYFVDEDYWDTKEISVRKIRAAVEAGGKARENMFKFFVTHEFDEPCGISANAIAVPIDKVFKLCDYRIENDDGFFC